MAGSGASGSSDQRQAHGVHISGTRSHRRTIEDRLAQCERLEAALREAVVNWRFYPAVLALQAMRGIQFTTAVGLLAELGTCRASRIRAS